MGMKCFMVIFHYITWSINVLQLILVFANEIKVDQSLVSGKYNSEINYGFYTNTIFFLLLFC